MTHLILTCVLPQTGALRHHELTRDRYYCMNASKASHVHIETQHWCNLLNLLQLNQLGKDCINAYRSALLPVLAGNNKLCSLCSEWRWLQAEENSVDVWGISQEPLKPFQSICFDSVHMWTTMCACGTLIYFPLHTFHCVNRSWFIFHSISLRVYIVPIRADRCRCQ